jgi:hypothetical protein
MIRAIDIQTPLLLYVEQDTPLVKDYDIPWEKLQSKILDGTSNLIRLHFEAQIPEEHKHLMVGKVEDELLKTVQWSQRPHLSSTAFYKRILSENFSPQAKSFLEDNLHGKVISDWEQFGIQGWHQWKLHVYHPEGVIKRSYHTDGRAGEEKYADKQTF